MPKAGVVVRAATFHGENDDFSPSPSFAFSRNRDACGLLGCLRVEELNLRGLCASGGMKFLHVVADGAPVNRASMRYLLTFLDALCHLGELGKLFAFPATQLLNSYAYFEHLTQSSGRNFYAPESACYGGAMSSLIDELLLVGCI